MIYEDKSDFEINSAVHNVVKKLGYKLDFLGNDKIKWSKYGQDDVFTGRVPYTKNGLQDYCNNISIAWPIIMENRITLTPYDNEKDSWFATTDTSFFVDHMNPLRAAVIVFLMMNEGKS